MPINTDLSVSPYFDDHDPNKNYYRVLFKPGVAPQVRELNELQTILQEQVERFGNNIYKRGTIIDGVNFIYYPNYSYIKITDSQLDGEPAVPVNYVSHFITDPTSNLTAHIINSVDGFESTDPDLKTLYLRYINSGNDGNTTTFNPGSTLTVYDYLDSVCSVIVNNGSSGFSNTDAVIFCSALDITLSTNTQFTVGETIAQTGNTNFAIVTGTSVVNGNTVLSIMPRTNDLSNTAVSSTVWEFTDGADIIGITSGATATINSSIGSGASATIITTADIGKITQVNIVSGGEGYYVSPYCNIKSSGAASTIGSRNYTSLNLTAQNYIAQLTVSSKANTVGYGYAFGVTEGVIYQKGCFVEVQPQTVIVSKHSPTPDNLSVGFDTAENIIDSNVDQDLLDNASGQPNEFAPGADRLQLTPTLVVLDTDSATANEEFLSLADFSNGTAYRENRTTQFNSIMDEMALRTRESSGDYVLDEFLVTTRSPANSAAEGQSFSVVVDPGRGYIDGYRVETVSNYYADVDKGIDINSTVNLGATLDYGNYVNITEVAGLWNCNVGTVVNLNDAATQFVTNTATNLGNLSASGNTIGSARVRNVVWYSGEPGTPSAIYRLYLFNIAMNAGKSFASVKGVQMGSTTAVSDIVLDFDATSNTNICKLYDSSNGSSLLIGTGVDATASLDNLTYVYRMTANSLSMANNGTTSLLLTDSSEYFAYESSTLTDTELRSLILVPQTDMHFLANTAADGTANITNGSNTITVSTGAVNKYNVGDFLALYQNTTSTVIRRITGKTSTSLSVATAVTATNAAANFSRALPKNVPVGLQRIPGASATLTGGNKTININLGTTLDATSPITCSLNYDVNVIGAAPQSKTATRDNFVKVQITNANKNGPWCLGIPDIFRLKAVYLGTSSTIDTTATDVTDQFFIDHNQTSDYYDLGYVYKRTDANITLGSGQWLLVQFDAFTSTPGVFTVSSYVSSNTAQRFSDDSLDLPSLGTKTNSFEVPEMYTSSGKYYDLINCIDFRPIATPTAIYATTPASASQNPSSTLTFDGSNKKFPLPQSGVGFDRESFFGRKDAVIITKDNLIKVVRGTASAAPKDPTIPSGVLFLNMVDIPPYPCVAANFSATMKAILDKKMSNQKYLVKRISDKTINVEVDDTQVKIEQPKGYSMADIGNLERRIKDLEYEVSLSLVQADLRDTVIPSAASPGIDRFKFGFFVDDYSTTQYSDTASPEYNCDVVDSVVVPKTVSNGVDHGPPPGGTATGTCTGDLIIVNQSLATWVPTVTVVTSNNSSSNTKTSNTKISNTSSNTVVSNTVNVTATMVSIFRSNKTTNMAIVSDTGWLTFSSVPSTYRIDYDFFSSPDSMKIEKQSANGSIITIRPDSDLVGTGTLTFTHDPSTGRNYKITVTRKTSSWKYTLTYPIDSTIYVAPTAPSTNTGSVSYSGTLVSGSPAVKSLKTQQQDFGITTFGAAGLTHEATLGSLKPGTIHQVTLADTSSSISVSPQVTTGDGSNLSSTSITSDSTGQASFKVHIDTTTMSQLPSLTGASQNSNIPSNIVVNVQSADGNSTAAINLKVDNSTTPASGPPSSSGGNLTVARFGSFRLNRV